jgi:hypothetical protein
MLCMEQPLGEGRRVRETVAGMAPEKKLLERVDFADPRSTL